MCPSAGRSCASTAQPAPAPGGGAFALTPLHYIGGGGALVVVSAAIGYALFSRRGAKH